jgi:hypothetical protein
MPALQGTEYDTEKSDLEILAQEDPCDCAGFIEQTWMGWQNGRGSFFKGQS